ncbi:flagellar hook-associated protein FlgK [Antarcticimicrobium luteum]|uniref:Flagellar hook-associated protein 1 n=1 Tax=Antarcticimicrobium luteum TaxID=2547397 RepID=A0A4R5VD65_9RHOB|nr:flagellar hook-associated protein FlgK [Antarcticimicrobium luteum]TDK50211.1 flagellar hook-associated protein FlgK [Antarcticimicrobium luteum]
MSLSSALNAAASGLATAQTQTRVVSDNIANAMTDGHVRREAVIVSTVGGGSQVSEVRRDVDAALVRMARTESGKMAHQQAISEGLSNYTIFLGQPGDGLSPAEKFSTFNTAMTTLVNIPSSTGAQSAAVFAAEDLAASVRGASDTLANVRAEVDMEIRYEVADLNQALYDLATLNGRMRDFGAGTLEAAQLGDRMDGLLDQVSEIVSIRVSQTSDGQVNIYTTGGAALLEGAQVQDVTFNPGDGTFFAGDAEITPGKAGVRGIDEGSLAGFSELLGDILPRFQLQLDEYARGLIQTFEAADASLSAGEAGLFTDNGGAYDPARLDGLASRLRVNDLVSQSAGSEVWRIRDGIGAAAPGAAADATQIQGFIDAMDAPLGADPETSLNATVTVANFAAEMVSSQSAERVRVERSYAAASSAAEMVQASRQNVEGVNIDDELQKLLLIEQSYAANSKMLTAVAEMLDTLLAAV